MALCLHGFDPDQCLICQTLGSATKEGTTKHRATGSRRRADSSERVTIPGGPVDVLDDRPRSGRGRATTRLLTAVAVVVLALIAFWVVVVAVHALLRLIEVALVAVVAAYLGYRVGRARGHDRR